MNNISGHFDRDKYEEHLDKYSLSAIRRSIREENEDIWNVPFYYDTYDADNDTTESEDEEEDDQVSSNEDSEEEIATARKKLRELL